MKTGSELPWSLPAEHRGLGLRTVDKDYKAHGGFQWPKGNGYCEAPDWSPEATCGGGLHLLPNGLGDWGLLNWELDAIAQVVEYDKRDAIYIDGDKIKVPRCNVIDTGSLASMMTRIAMIEAIALEATNASSGNSAKNASSGDSATNASSGNYAKNASSGNSAKNASSGNSATNASSGNSAKNASSGNSAKNASSGYYAKNASSGNSATNASSGDYATNASSGYYAKNEGSGKQSVCVAAGMNSMCKVGPDGAIAITWHDGNRPRIAVGYAGEDGIEANAWYKVVDGKLTKA